MTNLKELENQVKDFIANEEWSKAYKLCNQILELDNENSTFIKLRSHIEKEVKNSNKKIILKEIKKLEDLLQSQNYEEYLKQIAPLQSYAREVPEIEKLIISAKKLLEKQYLDRQKNALKQIEEKISRQDNSLNYQELIQELELINKINPQNKKPGQLISKVREIWINKELEANQGLIESSKYEDKIIFLLQLQKISPENSKVQKLITKTKASYQDFKIESKKDFIFKTTEEIKTLMIKRSYDKAIELCERILMIDNKNKQINKTLKLATRKARKKSEKLIYEQILENISNKEKQDLARV